MAETHPVELRGSAPLLLVYDMSVSLHFYRDVLGFTVAAVSEGSYGPDHYYWLMLRKDDIELMMEPKYTPAQRPANNDAIMEAGHDMLLYFGCPDVDGLYQHLRANGIEQKEPVNTSYGSKALHVKDPDGFLLVFHWPLQQ